MGARFSSSFKVQVTGMTIKVENAPNMMLENCDILCGEITGPIGRSSRSSEVETRKVALKRLRVAQKVDTRVERLKREADQWQQLKHPYILQFLGSCEDKDGNLYLASPWMENRSLRSYIQQHDDCDRPKFGTTLTMGHTKLREVCSAVLYLHAVCEVIHGDIRAENVLVSPGLEPHALLCDFGLSRQKYVDGDPDFAGAGSRNWQSPELFEGNVPSIASDIYAFGMTIYEVLSGKIPFDEYDPPMLLTAILINDERPRKLPATSSKGVSYEYLWAVAEKCWAKNATERPEMSEVYGELEGGYATKKG
ncbi:hypothetical protein FRB99_003561 [Tulasnella sp. 403]|nr:hypothetical protein FRB99_003561 [Tulasnella sp. 403]